MSKNLGFRGLFYFRQGWGNNGAFILSALSTLTVTYYLIIDNFPPFETVFVTFAHYVIIASAIIVPILILIGYGHWKKSGAMKAELDISYEENPYMIRILVDSELLIKLNTRLEKILTVAEDGEISKQELNELKELKNELKEFVENREFRSYDDWSYFKNKIK